MLPPTLVSRYEQQHSWSWPRNSSSCSCRTPLRCAIFFQQSATALLPLSLTSRPPTSHISRQKVWALLIHVVTTTAMFTHLTAFLSKFFRFYTNWVFLILIPFCLNFVSYTCFTMKIFMVWWFSNLNVWCTDYAHSFRFFIFVFLLKLYYIAIKYCEWWNITQKTWKNMKRDPNKLNLKLYNGFSFTLERRNGGKKSKNTTLNVNEITIRMNFFLLFAFSCILLC